MSKHPASTALLGPGCPASLEVGHVHESTNLENSTGRHALGEFKYRVNTKCNTGISVKMGVNAAIEIPARCLC